MKKAIQTRWASALRSGKYQQGKGGLNKDGKFCCLGVLCDLYSKETGRAWDDPLGSSILSLHGEINYLPEPVIEWAGLPSANPCFIENDETKNLAHENDVGRSFTEIADIIEQKL